MLILIAFVRIDYRNFISAEGQKASMEIKAFKAHRFNPAVVGEAGKCIAPPYDVINPAQQKKLYEQNPYNIVRIILGETKPADNDKKNQYSRAAEHFKDWLNKGALKQDDKETIYAYAQNFQIAGKKYQRSGFIALGKLAQFGSGVRPHEKTLDGPKADRLKLSQATAAQFELVFMLYDDPQQETDKIIEKAVAGKKSIIEFIDDDGVQHRLFSIDSAQDINLIVKLMAEKEVLIADGHHRYETAMNYYNLTRNPAAQWLMMAFVNVHNKGLVILPTHRLVGNVENFNFKKLLAEFSSDFESSVFAFSSAAEAGGAREKMFKKMRAEFDSGRTCFGIYAADKAFYAITLKNYTVMDKIASQLSTASRKLDVTVLHKLILEKVLGIGEQQLAGQTNIEYIKDIGSTVDEAIAMVDKGHKQVVFFMNPTRAEQVKQVAAANEKMPQKSTFFFPKIFSGLTINRL
jgi:uncharacterized protein (DUF1015 family)